MKDHSYAADKLRRELASISDWIADYRIGFREIGLSDRTLEDIQEAIAKCSVKAGEIAGM